MPAEPARRRPGPTPRFTRDHVFQAALALIDSGPPETFSLRRLADALGLTPMSLYSYVRDKDELVEGATMIALAAAHHEPGRDGSWQEKLTLALREIHDVLKQHPNLATLVIGRRSRAQGLYRIRERLLDTLLDAGFDEQIALYALGTLTYYALGFATGQAALADAPPDEVLPGLPTDSFPRLSASRNRYAQHASDEAFEFGLKHLIQGLERSKRRRR